MPTMLDPVQDHPGPDEILAWAAGHLNGTDRDLEIEAHLAGCTSPCGEYLTISMGVIEMVYEEEASKLDPEMEGSKEDRAATVELLRQKGEGDRLLDAAPHTWGTRLLEHPDRGNSMFLAAVAERAVYYADECPGHVLDFLKTLDPLIEDLPRLRRWDIKALLLLAEGIARRTQGDHLGALDSYARAEQEVGTRALSIEFARICVQRALSLRVLNRFDEARGELAIAGQVFDRVGVTGRGKVLWELANLAWQTPDPRRAFRLARRASHVLKEEGDPAQARMALHTAVSALIAMKRPSAAERLLRYLEREDPTTPYEGARLLWERGEVEALKGDIPGSIDLLNHAADAFAQAGSPLGAAQVLLDLSHVAAEAHDLPRQAAAAGQSAVLLAQIPGHPADLAIAVQQLQQAIHTGAGIAEIVTRLRERLRRS